MFKVVLYVLFLFSVNVMANTGVKEIAITFDDSPRAATGYFSGPQRASTLTSTLKAHNIEQVAFFSVSSRLDKEGLTRLKTYADAGHIIANHTHSHPDFNKLSLKQYQDDFTLAHEALNGIHGFVPYFRFPYLREGNTLKKRDGMRKTLQQLDYTNAYITLNNYDWFIENLFQEAVKSNHKIDMNKMRDFYVNVLIESIEYYDEMAIKHLGYSPKHVLLLHEMDISALFIGDLMDALRVKGWKNISMKQAYQDNLAKLDVDRLFKFNPGRVGEVARVAGQKKGLWHKSLDENYLTKRFNEEVLK